MKETKFDKIMNKVLVFCWKHRFAIGLGTTMLGAYCVGAHNQKETYKAQQKAIDDKKESQWRLARYQAEWKEYCENPANQLSSGGVVTDDAWDEGGTVNMILNDVPLDSMGAFGEALIERLRTNPGCMEQQEVNYILDNNPMASLVVCLYPTDEEKENTNEESSTDPVPVADDGSADGVQDN